MLCFEKKLRSQTSDQEARIGTKRKVSGHVDVVLFVVVVLVKRLIRREFDSGPDREDGQSGMLSHNVVLFVCDHFVCHQANSIHSR